MNEEQFLAYVQEVVDEILLKVSTASDLMDDAKVQRLLEDIVSLLDQMGVAMERVIPQEVIINYFGAVDVATKALASEGVAVASTIALTKEKTIAKAFQKKIHMEAVQEILDDTLLDLKAAIRTAKGSSRATVEEVIKLAKDDLARGLIAGDPNKVIRKRMIKAFQEKGLTSFKTKPDTRGITRNLPVDFYTKTVVRTKLREASVKGSSNRYLESGVKTVKISEHGSTCPVCGKFEGMVVVLEGEVEGFKSVNDSGVLLPPFHPNCRHTLLPFVLEYKSSSEIQKEKAKWKKFNVNRDTRTAEEKREYRKEQEIRRKANEEKKQYARYKALLGDEAPKTLGGFRRMKRGNTKSYQKLQRKYRKLSSQQQNTG